MPRRVYGSPFAIRWNDLPSVIAYCKRLNAHHSGDISVVFKSKQPGFYGITHKSRAIEQKYTILYPKGSQ